MLTSLSHSSPFPLLSLLILLPHSLLLRGCEATNNSLTSSHHTLVLSTRVSLPLIPTAHPSKPLTSPSLPPASITPSSLSSNLVSPAPPSPGPLPPESPSPVLLSHLSPKTSTPVSLSPHLISPGPSTPDSPSYAHSTLLYSPPDPSTSDPFTPVPSTHDPSMPDSPSLAPTTPGPPSPAPSTPELSTPAINEGPRKTGSDEGEGVIENQVKGKKMKEGLLMVKHFYLWTRRNPGNGSAQLLDPTRNKTISGSFFRPRKTFVVIHGFLGWGIEPWILQLKDKLLETTNSNVISVDWPAGTTWWLPGYYTAVKRVPSVAKDLSSLLHSLVTLWDLDLGDVHLIGHSLGAHVAGLAAAPLSTVGRISGLDPAGLMYHDVPPSQRLDSSDADYVDVIHTNGCKTLNKWLDCYGINENLGHSDFWPNGGRHQPSCGTRKGVSNGEIGCSHEMAYVYYIESLNYNVDQTYFLARPCSSWDDFTKGECGCGRETQYLGFSVNVRLNGTFYLFTNSTVPYAIQDSGCLPGSATGSGVRIIELALISSSALIASGAGVGAIVLQVAKRRSAAKRESGREEGGSDSGVSGVSGSSGGVNGDVAVDADDLEALLI